MSPSLDVRTAGPGATGLDDKAGDFEVLREALDGLDRHDAAWRKDFYESRGYIVDADSHPIRGANGKVLRAGQEGDGAK